MFVATGRTIFPKQHPIKRAVKGGGWINCMHKEDGIVKVLQQSFGHDTGAIRYVVLWLHAGCGQHQCPLLCLYTKRPDR